MPIIKVNGKSRAATNNLIQWRIDSTCCSAMLMEKFSHQTAHFQMSSQNNKKLYEFWLLCWQFLFLRINHMYIIWNRYNLLWQQRFNYCFKCICKSVILMTVEPLKWKWSLANCPQDPRELPKHNYLVFRFGIVKGPFSS